MITTIAKRLAGAVLIASLALPATALLPAAAPFATAQAHAATLAEFKATLAQYGEFMMHEKYGEIWVPKVTPPGWHPYPACQWVYTKDVGWYFNDTTAWGSIVHHYGRWANDTRIGWFWIPDENWSPAWVVWRSSDKWIGWAPMPPRQDVQLVSSADFSNDKLWTFIDLAKFGNGDCATSVPAAQVFDQTDYVSFFDLPPGLLIDIEVVPHWTVTTIKEIVEIIVDRRCPSRPSLRPIPATVLPPADGPKPISVPRPAGKPEFAPQRPRKPVRPINARPDRGPDRPVHRPGRLQRPIVHERAAGNGQQIR